MLYRIPKQIIFEFAEKLLSEAGVDDEAIENDLDSFIYEAGGRAWSFDRDDDDEFYYIYYDDDYY